MNFSSTTLSNRLYYGIVCLCAICLEPLSSTALLLNGADSAFMPHASHHTLSPLVPFLKTPSPP